ncbi:hypothetical protein KKG41_06215 [Patescibacteria group bacterium]|nr:hypothetical protein [Patescibacteria group bacterium]MBU1891082.1 hypothetical protein [Patescibacteria group bacterium]
MKHLRLSTIANGFNVINKGIANVVIGRGITTIVNGKKPLLTPLLLCLMSIWIMAGSICLLGSLDEASHDSNSTPPLPLIVFMVFCAITVCVFIFGGLGEASKEPDIGLFLTSIVMYVLMFVFSAFYAGASLFIPVALLQFINIDLVSIFELSRDQIDYKFALWAPSIMISFNIVLGVLLWFIASLLRLTKLFVKRTFSKPTS